MVDHSLQSFRSSCVADFGIGFNIAPKELLKAACQALTDSGRPDNESSDNANIFRD
jgi:hypothetical protein